MSNFFDDDDFDDPLAESEKVEPAKVEKVEEESDEEEEEPKRAVMPPVGTTTPPRVTDDGDMDTEGITIEDIKQESPQASQVIVEESDDDESDDEHGGDDEGFKFKVSDPSKSIRGKSYTFWVYQITTQTRMKSYERRHLVVKRRYSDFDWIRNHMVANNPGCIVPPIPEKSLVGSLEKYVTTINSQSLVQYRMRALTKFLTRVGEHQVLKHDKNLKRFLETPFREFERIRKITKVRKMPNTFLKKRLTKVPEWIPAHKIFAKKLNKSLSKLRKSMNDLVKKRRLAAQSFKSFGRGFMDLGSTERTYEDSPLSRALTLVGDQAEVVRKEMELQADKETMQVVETLTYYIGMTNGIDKVVKSLENLRLVRDDIVDVHKKKALNLEHAKIQLAPTHPKLVSMANEVINLKERQTQANKTLFQAEKNFKNDLEKFDLERRVDFGYLLHAFVSLQIKFHKIAFSSWEKTVPVVKIITTGE